MHTGAHFNGLMLDLVKFSDCASATGPSADAVGSNVRATRNERRDDFRPDYRTRANILRFATRLSWRPGPLPDVSIQTQPASSPPICLVLCIVGYMQHHRHEQSFVELCPSNPQQKLVPRPSPPPGTVQDLFPGHLRKMCV